MLFEAFGLVERALAATDWVLRHHIAAVIQARARDCNSHRDHLESMRYSVRHSTIRERHAIRMVTREDWHWATRLKLGHRERATHELQADHPALRRSSKFHKRRGHMLAHDVVLMRPDKHVDAHVRDLAT